MLIVWVGVKAWRRLDNSIRVIFRFRYDFDYWVRFSFRVL